MAKKFLERKYFVSRRRYVHPVGTYYKLPSLKKFLQHSATVSSLGPRHTVGEEPDSREVSAEAIGDVLRPHISERRPLALLQEMPHLAYAERGGRFQRPGSKFSNVSPLSGRNIYRRRNFEGKVGAADDRVAVRNRNRQLHVPAESLARIQGDVRASRSVKIQIGLVNIFRTKVVAADLIAPKGQSLWPMLGQDIRISLRKAEVLFLVRRTWIHATSAR
ncbi:hypothetical protein EVAR_57744_1 [Eumeta japonica]|uniref:Uncharacterized protein n=1 Tax=Eumeta variegata TaxID=151549 RepID=A0A4C1ZXI0_EUMVA|nr:hypothetical protein EVAR_57744_1 [Eumeta japonica]